MDLQDDGEYGVKYLTFKDNDDNKCNLREALTANNLPLIGLGRRGSVMWLTQQQVKSLLPLLENFAKTGDL